MLPSCRPKSINLFAGCLVGLTAVFVGDYQVTPNQQAQPPAFLTAVARAGRTVVRLPSVERNRRWVLVVSNRDPASHRHVTVSRTTDREPAAALQPFVNPPSQQIAEFPGSYVGYETRRGSSPADAPATRTFRMHHGSGDFNDERFYSAVQFRRVWVTKALAIYLHPAADQPPADQLAAFATLFREQRLRVDRLLAATVSDVDHDGRFTVLIVPPGQGADAPRAFVRPADFDPSARCPFGNQADVMYFAGIPRDRELTRTLIAHEYAHAVCCGIRPGRTEEDWLNEAIAHRVETQTAGCPKNTAHRVLRFLDQPHAYPLVVENYHEAGLWREHGCRGAVISFLADCCRRHGDAEILRALIRGSRGVANVSTATSKDFVALNREWIATLAAPLAGERSPHVGVCGGFLFVGPRLQPLDRAIRIAPTAHAWFDIPADTSRVAIEATGTHAPGLMLVRAVRDGADVCGRLIGDRLCVVVTAPDSGSAVVRITFGCDTCRDGRAHRLAIRRDASPRAVQTRSSEFTVSGVSDAFPLSLRAMVEFADGSVAVGQSVLHRQPQLAGR